MEVNVSIKVRNPEWYWSNDEDDLYKEWQIMNEDKVQKYIYGLDYGFAKEVLSVDHLDDTSYELDVSPAGPPANPGAEKMILDGVSITHFRFAEGKSTLIISKSLIHSLLVEQPRNAKYYRYYYLYENVPYHHLAPGLWLSEQHYSQIKGRFGEFIMNT